MAITEVSQPITAAGQEALRQAAPELYAAAKLSQGFIKALKEQYPELAADYRVGMLETTLDAAITKAESWK